MSIKIGEIIGQVEEKRQKIKFLVACFVVIVLSAGMLLFNQDNQQDNQKYNQKSDNIDISDNINSNSSTKKNKDLILPTTAISLNSNNDNNDNNDNNHNNNNSFTTLTEKILLQWCKQGNNNISSFYSSLYWLHLNNGYEIDRPTLLTNKDKAVLGVINQPDTLAAILSHYNDNDILIDGTNSLVIKLANVYLDWFYENSDYKYSSMEAEQWHLLYLAGVSMDIKERKDILKSVRTLKRQWLSLQQLPTSSKHTSSKPSLNNLGSTKTTKTTKTLEIKTIECDIAIIKLLLGIATPRNLIEARSLIDQTTISAINNNYEFYQIIVGLLDAQLDAVIGQTQVAIIKIERLIDFYRVKLSLPEWQSFKHYLYSQLATYYFVASQYEFSASMSYELVGKQISNGCAIGIQSVEVLALSCLEIGKRENNVELEKTAFVLQNMDNDQAIKGVTKQNSKAKLFYLLGKEYLELAAFLASKRGDYAHLMLIENFKTKYGIMN